ncbi:hypothetical protein Tco_0630299 [Tanacetum coccineum]
MLRRRHPYPTKGREDASSSTKGRKGPPALQVVRIESLTSRVSRLQWQGKGSDSLRKMEEDVSDGNEHKDEDFDGDLESNAYSDS